MKPPFEVRSARNLLKDEHLGTFQGKGQGSCTKEEVREGGAPKLDAGSRQGRVPVAADGGIQQASSVAAADEDCLTQRLMGVAAIVVATGELSYASRSRNLCAGTNERRSWQNSQRS